MKQSLKSQRLADRIAQLEAEMKAAQRAEHEAAEKELVSLVNRAGCLDAALDFARKALARKRAERGARNDYATGSIDDA
jgi:hypothetical protein